MPRARSSRRWAPKIGWPGSSTALAPRLPLPPPSAADGSMRETGPMSRPSTFIGRGAELRRLVEVGGAVTSGDAGCRFVVVAGEAGIGKTRLVDELTAAIAPPMRVLR